MITKQLTKKLSYVLIGAGLILSSCSKEKKKGSSIGAPALKPPVDEATPSGIKSSTALTVAQSALCDVAQGGDSRSVKCILDNLKSDVFSTVGPTFLNDLDTVDKRLAEFDSRAVESERTCLTETAKPWTPAILGESFAMHVSCRENMSEALSVFFGRHEGNFYLSEIQTPLTPGPTDFTGGIFAKANDAGNQVESWKYSYIKNTQGDIVTLLHVVADRATNVMEFRTASTHAAFSAGCGVHFRSNGEHIKAKVWRNPVNLPGDCDTEPLEVCVNAADLSLASDATACSGITFGYTSLTRATLGAENTKESAVYKSIATHMAKEGIPGLTDFNSVNE